MTKKDYELVAKTIKSERFTTSVIYHNCLDTVSKGIADALAEQNKRFKRDQFLKDCGVTVQQPAFVNNKGQTVYYKD